MVDKAGRPVKTPPEGVEARFLLNPDELKAFVERGEKAGEDFEELQAAQAEYTLLIANRLTDFVLGKEK
jgi:anion-transporting  ArsA/GET3 family ATPase